MRRGRPNRQPQLYGNGKGRGPAARGAGTSRRRSVIGSLAPSDCQAAPDSPPSVRRAAALFKMCGGRSALHVSSSSQGQHHAKQGPPIAPGCSVNGQARGRGSTTIDASQLRPVHQPFCSHRFVDVALKCLERFSPSEHECDLRWARDGRRGVVRKPNPLPAIRRLQRRPASVDQRINRARPKDTFRYGGTEPRHGFTSA